MARAGRPRNHDPKADDVRQAIRYSSSDNAITAIRSCDVNVLDGEARTPFIHAVFEGKMAVAEWLAVNGADINHQDRNGWTALHYAVQGKRRDMVEFLLKNGADVDVRDIHGNTPLWRAVFDARGQYELVIMLLAHKADPTSKNNANRSPLDFAIQISDKTLEEKLRTG